MSCLDSLPMVKKSACGITIKAGSILAALWGIITSSAFIGMSYTNKIKVVETWIKDLYTVMSIFFFITSLILLIGVFNETELLCQLWVYAAIMYLIGVGLVTFVIMYAQISKGYFWLTWWSFGGLILFGVYFYLMVVVNSFRFALIVDVYGSIAVILSVSMGYLLDWIPEVDTFFTICSVKTGSLVMAVLGIIHPSLLTMYVHRDLYEKTMAKIGNILSSSYFVASLLLLIGVLVKNVTICALFVWFTIVFVAVCLVVMLGTGIRLVVIKEWQVSFLACLMVPLLLFSFLCYGGVVINSHVIELEMDLKDVKALAFNFEE